MLRSFFSFLPPFKGKHRLARLFFSGKINNGKNLIVKGHYGIKYKVPNLKENVAFDIYVEGAYEKQYIHFLAENIPENGLLLDLGANIGSICIPVSKLRPDIKIIAVEASPRVFSYLEYNVGLNECANIFLENYALSSTDGEKIAFYSPEEKFGKGSMSPVFTDKAEYVDTVTVDSLLIRYNFKKVDFIKIDVEGYEANVFSGAKEILSGQDAPAILFEFAHWAENQAMNCKAGDAQQYLIALGYSLYNINDVKNETRLNQVLVNGTFMILARKGKQ